jgi:hypothetical protein
MFVFLVGPILGVILALTKPQIVAVTRTLIPFFSRES